MINKKIKIKNSGKCKKRFENFREKEKVKTFKNPKNQEK